MEKHTLKLLSHSLLHKLSANVHDSGLSKELSCISVAQGDVKL